MRFDLGTLDSGERSLPFGLLVPDVTHKFLATTGMTKLVKDGELVLVTFSMGLNFSASLHLIQEVGVHMIRATVGKLVRDGELVFLTFSGDPNSSALLHLTGGRCM